MQVIVHFDTNRWSTKKTKYPLVHLKFYNEQNSGESSGIENSDGENMRDQKEELGCKIQDVGKV